jgi:uncharacterized protein YbaP (TraB family)
MPKKNPPFPQFLYRELKHQDEDPMKRILRALLAAILAAVALPAISQTPAPAPAAPPATGPAILTEATPALWTVKGPHAMLYLFGSVHVMKKDVHWETPKVKDALTASSTLYLEIAGLDPASVQAAQPEIMQLGTDQEHPLSTKLSKPDIDLLDQAVKTMGLPGEQALEPMQPWLAYLSISVVPMIQAGYDPKSGIDTLLEAEAKAANKPVKGLETLSQQIHYLADMAPALQLQMLHQALVDMPKSVAETNTMVADWTRGDVDAIAKMNNDEMKTKYPELYKTLLVERNERFADALAAMLKDPAGGTSFIAIGAAHLAGPDSVLKMLEKRGFTATRVE